LKPVINFVCSIINISVQSLRVCAFFGFVRFFCCRDELFCIVEDVFALLGNLLKPIPLRLLSRAKRRKRFFLSRAERCLLSRAKLQIVLQGIIITNQELRVADGNFLRLDIINQIVGNIEIKLVLSVRPSVRLSVKTSPCFIV
jgi:hypothetical protein